MYHNVKFIWTVLNRLANFLATQTMFSSPKTWARQVNVVEQLAHLLLHERKHFYDIANIPLLILWGIWVTKIWAMSAILEVRNILGHKADIKKKKFMHYEARSVKWCQTPWQAHYLEFGQKACLCGRIFEWVILGLVQVWPKLHIQMNKYLIFVSANIYIYLFILYTASISNNFCNS